MLGREIARLTENAAQDILNGVPPERYLAAVARYEVLLELMRYMEDHRNEGDVPDDD